MAIQLREHKRECWVEDRFSARECWPYQYEHPEDCDVCGGCGEVTCTDPLCDCRVTCESCGSTDVSWSLNGDGARVVCAECGCVFDAEGAPQA